MGSYGAFKASESDKLASRIKALEYALREIETICTESPSALRKRMGTRVGNILVVAQIGLSGAPE